jgi:hypothetical protein
MAAVRISSQINISRRRGKFGAESVFDVCKNNEETND